MEQPPRFWHRDRDLHRERRSLLCELEDARLGLMEDGHRVGVDMAGNQDSGPGMSTGDDGVLVVGPDAVALRRVERLVVEADTRPTWERGHHDPGGGFAPPSRVLINPDIETWMLEQL